MASGRKLDQERRMRKFDRSRSDLVKISDSGEIETFSARENQAQREPKMNAILDLLEGQPGGRIAWLFLLMIVIFWGCSCSIVVAVVLTVEGLGW